MSIWKDKPDLITLIHDTNNSLSLLGARLRQLDAYNKENVAKMRDAGINDTKSFIIAESFRAELKRIEGVIDIYYEKEKAKYEQEVKAGTNNTK